MSLVNKSIYAILGILSIQPSTGYDIKRYSDKVLSGFWNENFGHIYPTLKKMIESGLIENVPGEVEDRKIKYAITEKGKGELKKWLSEEIQTPAVRSELMLKLLFGNDMSKEATIDMLSKQKDIHEENLIKYLTMQQELTCEGSQITAKRSVYYNAILRKGIINSAANIEWCEETIESLKKLKG
ncbi:MAG: PadR family transcriptional regulator [Saccharofermentanaceae bacterium]|jgi:DNA-binding PadR family transcriptional regulator|nr:PadR family transcriptional regulator [Clostridia bacterium]NLX68956.1 PadR family transcriptional regulator [Clostridiaceae bacterium]HOO48845.1 PadR family transcriptional regulator [Saccharofermentans sp.]HPG64411.1 PadR family transcriptional regulator [Saccharofermentans sp.]HPJ82025.1 PadR family transcriptional regulator [Saccharofermentans sp.]